MWCFLKNVYRASVENHITARAAALAYYLIFAIVPILILFFSIGGLLVDATFLQTRVISFFIERFGNDAAGIVRGITDNLIDKRTNITVTVVVSIITIGAAINFFNYLRRTFSLIFDVQRKNLENKVAEVAKVHGISFLYLVILFVLIFVFIAVNLLLSVAFEVWGELVGVSPSSFVQSTQTAVTFLLSGIVASLVYRITSQQGVSWRSALVGGVVAAIGFALLKVVLGLYLSFALVPSIYGASGFVLVFLLWNYFAGLIIFLGAETAKVYNEQN